MENKNTLEKLIAKALSDPTFKKQLKESPKEKIQEELGIEFPKDLEIKVVENTNQTIYIVLPLEEEFSDQHLEAIAGGVLKSRSEKIKESEKQYRAGLEARSHSGLPPESQ